MKLLPSFKSAKAICLAAVTIATAIAAANVTSTLAQTTPTPDLNSKHGDTRPGSISFSNSGPNLITKFYVKYTVAGKSFTFESENLLAPGKVRFSISPKATDIVAIGKYFTGLEKPILFEKPIKPGSNVCFKIFRNGPFPFSPVAFDNSCTEIPVTPPTPPFTPPTPTPPVQPQLNLPVLFPTNATRVIHYPGKPQVVIFGETMEAFPLGCMALRNLWSGLKTEPATLDEYDRMMNMRGTKFGISIRSGDLYCNDPNRVKAYISPLFGQYAGAIVTDGKPFLVNSREFFTTMGITPVQLNDQQARDFVNNSRFSSTLLTTKK
jgi:hypothetical protein